MRRGKSASQMGFYGNDIHSRCDNDFIFLSVMVARGAQWNPSVFNPNGMLPVWDMMSQYLDLAKLYENHFANTKYTLCKMQSTHVKGAASNAFTRCKTYDDLDAALEKVKHQPNLIREDYKVPQPVLERHLMNPNPQERKTPAVSADAAPTVDSTAMRHREEAGADSAAESLIGPDKKRHKTDTAEE